MINRFSLFHQNSEKNKFGYYTVAGYKTYSKYDAYQVSAKLAKPIAWNFNNEIFSLQDWKTEPAESLEEIYKKRAEQLRNKYDHIVLWYSGGSDSHNIAEVFLRNNIFLDEIAVIVNTKGLSGIDEKEPINAEPYKVAFPYMYQYKEKSPHTRLNFFDIFPILEQSFRDREFIENIPYLVNEVGSPHHISKGQIRTLDPYFRQLTQSGKKVCFVWGCDKPRVGCDNGKWYSSFVDMTDGSIRSQTQIMNLPHEYDEMFYWTPDLPDLAIKQAHAIKKVLSTDYGKSLLENDRNIYNKLVSMYGVDNVSKSSFEFNKTSVNGIMPSSDTYRRIIYPYWDFSTFTIGKSWTGNIYSVRDKWIYSSNVDFIKESFFSAIKPVVELAADKSTQFSFNSSIPTGFNDLIERAGHDLNNSNTLPAYFKRYSSGKFYLN